MMMPGRIFTAEKYHYGFNGKENDIDIANGIQDYGFRIFNQRLGRFISVDPLTGSYPQWAPYQYAGNSPVWTIDIDGLEPNKVTDPSQVSDPDQIADRKTLEDAEVKVKIKLTFWQKVGHFGKGLIKGVITGAAVIAAVVITTATCGAAAPFIVTGITAVCVYGAAKTTTELITGKEDWGRGRKLSKSERYDIGGQLVGGFLIGAGAVKTKLFRLGSGKKKLNLQASESSEASVVETNSSSQTAILETKTAESNNPSVVETPSVKQTNGVVSKRFTEDQQTLIDLVKEQQVLNKSNLKDEGLTHEQSDIVLELGKEVNTNAQNKIKLTDHRFSSGENNPPGHFKYEGTNGHIHVHNKHVKVNL